MQNKALDRLVPPRNPNVRRNLGIQPDYISTMPWMDIHPAYGQLLRAVLRITQTRDGRKLSDLAEQHLAESVSLTKLVSCYFPSRIPCEVRILRHL